MAARKSQLKTEALRHAIEARAYAIWKHQGRPHGCDLDHWLQAETEVRASRQSKPETTAAARAARPVRPRRKP